MKLIYVAGPYRASSESQIVANIRNAEAVAVALWQAGFAALCPHKNTALFGGLCPDEVWLKGDLAMLERCDAVVVVPKWENSSGTKAEIAHAEVMGIPVYFFPEMPKHPDPEPEREPYKIIECKRCGEEYLEPPPSTCLCGEPIDPDRNRYAQ